MASKPESRLQEKIRKALERSVGGFWFKAHGGPYQARGLPDLIGCVEGFYVAIEVKVNTKKPTALQRATIKTIKRADGVSFVATDPEEAVSLLLKRLNGKFRSSRVYSSWRCMIARCYNPKHISYKYYGKRGITVCPTWRKGVFFLWRDLGFPPDSDELLYYLDRIDNDKGYNPSNCRWATRAESNENKRDTRRLTYNGVTKPLSHWASQYGISKQLLSYRLSTGMSIHKALTTPVRKNVS